MAETYLERMDSQALRLRWISVQCYEIVLPGGKVLVTDPFYWDISHFDGMAELAKNQKMEKEIYAQSGFSVDDFTGADYILLFLMGPFTRCIRATPIILRISL